MSDPEDMEDDNALAAEYAMGLLEGAEARAARARTLSDPAFAAEVAFWQERLAVLADEVEDIAPSPRAKSALTERLFGDATTRTRGLGFWKGLSGLAAVAAAAFAFIAFIPEDVAGPPALFVSEIASDASDLRVLAVVDATAHSVRLTRTAGAAASGRVLELWGIPGDGTGPVSFGVIPETETAEFTVPDALLGKADGLTLAISDEPPGGSPTGQPTGEVLATGPLTRL